MSASFSLHRLDEGDGAAAAMCARFTGRGENDAPAMGVLLSSPKKRNSAFRVRRGRRLGKRSNAKRREKKKKEQTAGAAETQHYGCVRRCVYCTQGRQARSHANNKHKSKVKKEADEDTHAPTNPRGCETPRWKNKEEARGG